MIASLIATVAALVIGLPLFALGERARERSERRLLDQHTSSTRKDLP